MFFVFVTLFIITQLFDGILFQFQSIFFKNYLVKPVIFKILLFFICIPIITINRTKLPLFLSVVFLFICIICNFLYTEPNIQGANTYYSVLIVCSLIYLAKSDYRSQIIKSRKYILAVFFIAVFIAILQIMGVDSLNISINNDNFIQSQKIYGAERVFSLFSSGLNLGYVIVVAMLISQTSQNMWVKLFTIVISGVLIYFTYTRVVYVMYLLAIIGLISTRFWKYVNQRYRIITQIAFYLFISYLITYFVSQLPVSRDLSSSESIGMRLDQWSDLWNYIVGSNLAEFVIGTGLTQGDNLNREAIIIDNMYLAVFLNIGLIGFITWILLLTSYINSLLRIVSQNNKMIFEIIVYMWIFSMMYNLSVGIFEIASLVSAFVFLREENYEQNSGIAGNIQR